MTPWYPRFLMNSDKYRRGTYSIAADCGMTGRVSSSPKRSRNSRSFRIRPISSASANTNGGTIFRGVRRSTSFRVVAGQQELLDCSDDFAPRGLAKCSTPQRHPCINGTCFPAPSQFHRDLSRSELSELKINLSGWSVDGDYSWPARLFVCSGEIECHKLDTMHLTKPRCDLHIARTTAIFLRTESAALCGSATPNKGRCD